MQEKKLALFEQISLKYFESMLNQHTTHEIPVTRWTQFSWSTSRHHTFTRCRREYYLNYYASRNVREANDPAVSAVWWLKRITSLKAWIGTTIHETAAKVLSEVKADRKIAEDYFTNLAVEYYLRGVEASSEGKKFFNPLDRDAQGEHVSLDGHVYEIPSFNEDIRSGEGRVTSLMNTLFGSEAYRWIQTLPTQALFEIDPPFQTFMLNDIPQLGTCAIFAIPDVLVHDDGKITIIDWKTGDHEKEGIRLQAGVYRLYAIQKYQAPEEAVTVVISALGADGASLPPAGGLPTAAEAQDAILSSIADMLGCLQSVKYNTAAIGDFPMTDDLSQCKECAFRRACWRDENSGGQMTLF